MNISDNNVRYPNLIIKCHFLQSGNLSCVFKKSTEMSNFDSLKKNKLFKKNVLKETKQRIVFMNVK